MPSAPDRDERQPFRGTTRNSRGFFLPRTLKAL